MERSATTKRETFDVLNGLRGVAAIAVVTMHLLTL